MATHSSILDWRIPWTEELGGVQSTGHKESDTTERLHFTFTFQGELRSSPFPLYLVPLPSSGKENFCEFQKGILLATGLVAFFLHT